MISCMKIDLWSESLCQYMKVDVLMPHDTGGRPVRVLYLLHGLSDDSSVWLHRTNIERYADAVGDLCVVLPSAHRSWYANTAAGLAYRTYVFEELPEKIAQMFRVSTRREDTFVAGNSMGGYGALKFGLLHPERFRAVFPISGAFRAVKYFPSEAERLSVFGEEPEREEDVVRLASEADTVNTVYPEFRLFCGKDDFCVGDNREMYALMKEKGFNVAYDETEGSHCWDFWDDAIKKICARSGEMR